MGGRTGTRAANGIVVHSDIAATLVAEEAERRAAEEAKAAKKAAAAAEKAARAGSGSSSDASKRTSKSRRSLGARSGAGGKSSAKASPPARRETEPPGGAPGNAAALSGFTRKQLEQALARLSRGSSGEDARMDDFDGDSSASEDDTEARDAELQAAAAAKAAKVAKRAYEAANAIAATTQAALAAASPGRKPKKGKQRKVRGGGAIVSVGDSDSGSSDDSDSSGTSRRAKRTKISLSRGAKQVYDAFKTKTERAVSQLFQQSQFPQSPTINMTLERIQELVVAKLNVRLAMLLTDGTPRSTNDVDLKSTDLCNAVRAYVSIVAVVAETFLTVPGDHTRLANHVAILGNRTETCLLLDDVQSNRQALLSAFAVWRGDVSAMLTGGSTAGVDAYVQKMGAALVAAEKAKIAAAMAAAIRPPGGRSRRENPAAADKRPGNNAWTTCKFAAADCKAHQKGNCKRKHAVAARRTSSGGEARRAGRLAPAAVQAVSRPEPGGPQAAARAS